MWVVVVPLHTISSQLIISITLHSCCCFELGYGSKITTAEEQVAHCGMALALTPSSNQQHSNAPWSPQRMNSQFIVIPGEYSSKHEIKWKLMEYHLFAQLFCQVNPPTILQRNSLFLVPQSSYILSAFGTHAQNFVLRNSLFLVPTIFPRHCLLLVSTHKSS